MVPRIRHSVPDSFFWSLELAALVDLWWEEVGKHHVLPLDDRFRECFVINAGRFHASRKRYVFHAGMGHLPTEVAPDVRGRSYLIEADVHIGDAREGVLIAHGDATTGYSLYVQSGYGEPEEYATERISAILLSVQSALRECDR